MVLTHILTHGLVFAFIVNGYLLLMMLTTSPRVWGYADYSEAIKLKVPPQTREEKRLASGWTLEPKTFLEKNQAAQKEATNTEVIANPLSEPIIPQVFSDLRSVSTGLPANRHRTAHSTDT